MISFTVLMTCSVPWSQSVMRVTAHADHCHLDPPQSAYGGLSLAIRVYGIQSKVSRNYRDKGPTKPAGAAQPNYMLPLHATGLNRSSSACRGGLCTPTCAPDGSLRDRTVKRCV
jgi:hypothetical protein